MIIELLNQFTVLFFLHKRYLSIVHYNNYIAFQGKEFVSGIIGNTSTRFIPRDEKARKIVQPGKNYFLVKIHNSQAAFSAPFWKTVNSLIVTSSVSLNHPVLGLEPIRAIQCSRNVKKGIPEKLGSSKNLINFVPAKMGHISISIEFILDTHNQMANLSKLINTGAFVTSISLGPALATTAKTISEISQKLIDTFIPDPNQREPILQFREDFNIPAEELIDGFYVILGTRDPKKPLPDPSAIMEVKGYDLLVNGRPATDWSYVILSVRSIDARSRALNEGAIWEKKLRESEGIAGLIEADSFAEIDDKRKAWEKCKGLIKDAQALLLNDDNYLRDEAISIYKNAIADCYKMIFGDKSSIVNASRATESEEIKQDREFLGIPIDEDLDATLTLYKYQLAETKRIIQEEEANQK